MSFITRAYGATKLALKANAPTIMVVAGVTSMGAAAVFASKKTLHLEEVLGTHVVELEAIKETLDNKAMSQYDEKKAAKDRGVVYGRAAYDLTKLYAVPGVLFVGGAALVFSGHRVMLKRNATLALAFTALNESFESYRKRVVEKIGHDADQAFFHGAVNKEVIDPETGKVEEISTRDWEASGQDPYNRVFEQGASSEWQPDLGINKMFIANQQRFAQQRLNRQGYLYLSDVYKALGFEESDISRVVGWKVTRLPDGTKDVPFVDFGLDKPMPDDWKYNREHAVYLDFNCQGLIVGGKVQKLLEQR
jgi:hypothetical protein